MYLFRGFAKNSYFCLAIGGVERIGKPLDDVEKPNHARYIEIFNEVYSFDKRLVARYDGITGGRYFDTVSYLLSEGILNEEDLEICDETMRDELVRIKEIFSRL